MKNIVPLLPGHGSLQPLDLDRIPALLVVVVQDDGEHDGGGLDVELENENAFTDFSMTEIMSITRKIINL
jgi:hypothetical protein